MVTMEKAYKFRAYPSKEQHHLINGQMFLAKQLYNMLLEKSKKHFKDTGKTFSQYDMNKLITQLKKKNPEFQEIYSQVLQNVADRVAKAYKNFFSRIRARKKGKKVKVGFPRFKKFVSSLTYPQDNGSIRIEKKRVSLSHIGRINFVNHREIEGTMKTLTIKKTKSGEWYITISVEQEDRLFVSNNKPIVGMDLGLTEYATLSDKTKVENKRFGKKFENKQKKAQRELSRRKKGGKNRNKSRIKVARISGHITRSREDFAHKLSYNLVNSYSFIAHETLQIQNMVKNHRLAKSINDASWGRTIQYLHNKAGNAGCEVIGIGTFDPSTQECSGCRNVKEGTEKLTIDNRIYHCFRCGLVMDRDLNASLVILKKGIIKSTAGHAGSHAFGDIVRPSHMKADVVELGTKFGEPS